MSEVSFSNTTDKPVYIEWNDKDGQTIRHKIEPGETASLDVPLEGVSMRSEANLLKEQE